MPPASVIGYLELVRDALQEASGAKLRGMYLHGSAVLGGWVEGKSDVDALLIAADDVDASWLSQTADVLVETASACPGSGLESSIVSAAAAAAATPPWPFLVHVATGPGEPGGSRVVPGSDQPGDRDLLMHYAVCRVAGWPVLGPAPQDLIGSVSRHAILRYLADELAWGLEHADEAYAVLNACRAQIYLTDDEIVSKVAGGETALRRGSGPAELIRSALNQQRGTAPRKPPGADAIEFVRATAELLCS